MSVWTIASDDPTRSDVVRLLQAHLDYARSLSPPEAVYALGDGPRRVLIIGGQHGGPEANTVELVGGLLDYFDSNPDQIPKGIELDILPVANPDGLAAGSRQFASGVDPFALRVAEAFARLKSRGVNGR